MSEQEFYETVQREEEMLHSEQINEIAAALSKAQAAMSGAVKGSANPFFKSSYADLGAVCGAIKEAFADNNLSYTQLPSSVNGRVSVTTMLMHSSGQWIKSRLEMRPAKDDPQAFGSVITYARRYALAAIAGVPQVDDDAESAMNRNAPKVVNEPVKKITKKQAGELTDLMTKYEIESKKFLEYFKIDSVSDLPANLFERARKTVDKGEAA